MYENDGFLIQIMFKNKFRITIYKKKRNSCDPFNFRIK